jgi:hypothetical protein
MTDPYEYDHERALWKPGRRGFLSMFVAAVVAPLLPDLPVIARPSLVIPIIPDPTRLLTSDLVTKALAFEYKNEIKWANKISRSYGDALGAKVGDTIRVRLPQRFHA